MTGWVLVCYTNHNMESIRIAKVVKVGNSIAVIIPSGFAKQLGIRRGDYFAFATYWPGIITMRLLSDEEITKLKPPLVQVE